LCRRNLATGEGRSKRKPRMGLRGFRKVAWRKRGTISSAASPAYPVSAPRLRRAVELPDVQVRVLTVRFAALRATAAATCVQAPAFVARVRCARAAILAPAPEFAATILHAPAPIDLDHVAQAENTRAARRCCRPRRVREVWAASPDAARRIRRPDPSASGRRAILRACSRRADSPCPECLDACAVGPDPVSSLPRAADVESVPSPTRHR